MVTQHSTQLSNKQLLNEINQIEDKITEVEKNKFNYRYIHKSEKYVWQGLFGSLFLLTFTIAIARSKCGLATTSFISSGSTIVFCNMAGEAHADRISMTKAIAKVPRSGFFRAYILHYPWSLFFDI